MTTSTGRNLPTRVDEASDPQIRRLSFAQEQLWFLDQLTPGKTTYNILMVWRLHGRLQVDLLRRSVNLLVARHESLRVTIHNHEGTPYQVVAPAAEASLVVTDLCGLPEAQREQRVRAEIDAQCARPYDLETGPLCRFGLLRLDTEEYVFFQGFHHIITDGWSAAVMNKELATAYRSLYSGSEPVFEDRELDYIEFAESQRQRLQGDALADELAFWQEWLADLPVLELPADRPRPTSGSHRGQTLIQDFPDNLRGIVQQLADDHGVSMFMVLAAGLNLVLSRYSGLEDIPIGVPMLGLNLVPRGVTGELLIGGEPDSLVQGRLNRSEVSAEKFLDDPFQPGQLVYRSGDLARWSADLRIEVLGRLDDQIRLRGLRIDLGSIEAVLTSHPTAGHAAVVVRPDQDGEDHLVGYVAPAAGRTPAPDELRAHLAGTLPGHMIPAAWVVLDEFPLLADGTVDRDALPDPADPAADRDGHEPRTPTEQAIAEIFGAVLSKPRVGAQDRAVPRPGGAPDRLRVAAGDHGLGRPGHRPDRARGARRPPFDLDRGQPAAAGRAGPGRAVQRRLSLGGYPTRTPTPPRRGSPPAPARPTALAPPK